VKIRLLVFESYLGGPYINISGCNNVTFFSSHFLSSNFQFLQKKNLLLNNHRKEFNFFCQKLFLIPQLINVDVRSNSVSHLDVLVSEWLFMNCGNSWNVGRLFGVFSSIMFSVSSSSLSFGVCVNHWQSFSFLRGFEIYDDTIERLHVLPVSSLFKYNLFSFFYIDLDLVICWHILVIVLHYPPLVFSQNMPHSKFKKNWIRKDESLSMTNFEFEYFIGMVYFIHL